MRTVNRWESFRSEVQIYGGGGGDISPKIAPRAWFCRERLASLPLMRPSRTGQPYDIIDSAANNTHNPLLQSRQFSITSSSGGTQSSEKSYFMSEKQERGWGIFQRRF
jgi:hypothetical protein